MKGDSQGSEAESARCHQYEATIIGGRNSPGIGGHLASCAEGSQDDWRMGAMEDVERVR